MNWRKGGNSPRRNCRRSSPARARVCSPGIDDSASARGCGSQWCNCLRRDSPKSGIWTSLGGSLLVSSEPPHDPLPIHSRILKIHQQTKLLPRSLQVIETLRRMLSPQPIRALKPDGPPLWGPQPQSPVRPQRRCPQNNSPPSRPYN